MYANLLSVAAGDIQGVWPQFEEGGAILDLSLDIPQRFALTTRLSESEILFHINTSLYSALCQFMQKHVIIVIAGTRNSNGSHSIRAIDHAPR